MLKECCAAYVLVCKLIQLISRPFERKLWRKHRSIFPRSIYSAKCNRKKGRHVEHIMSINAWITNKKWDIPQFSLVQPSSLGETLPLQIGSTEHKCSSAKWGPSSGKQRKPWMTSWLLRAVYRRPKMTDKIT